MLWLAPNPARWRCSISADVGEALADGCRRPVLRRVVEDDDLDVVPQLGAAGARSSGRATGGFAADASSLQRLEAGEQKLARVRVDEGDGDVGGGTQRRVGRAATSAWRAASTASTASALRSQACRSPHRRPRSRSPSEPEPLLSLQRVSAKQCRMSPARYWSSTGSAPSRCPARRKRRGDLDDRVRAAGAEVRGRCRSAPPWPRRARDAAHDIATCDEVARLTAVLEDGGRPLSSRERRSRPRRCTGSGAPEARRRR